MSERRERMVSVHTVHLLSSQPRTEGGKQTTHDPPTYLPRMTVISSHRPLSRLEGAGYGIYLFFLVHSLIDRMTRDQQIEDNSFKVIKDRIFIIIILLTPRRFPFSLRWVMKEKDTNKGTDQTRPVAASLSHHKQKIENIILMSYLAEPVLPAEITWKVVRAPPTVRKGHENYFHFIKTDNKYK